LSDPIDRGPIVNPLIWIRLLAYGERVAFERQRANDVVVAGRTDAHRSRIIGELRAALDRALAADTNRSARDTVVRSDRPAESFLIATGGGRNVRTMQVSPSGTGVECSYAASDPGSNGAGGQRRLQVSFPGLQLTPAVILESGVSTKCDTPSVLCEQLLGRLTSRAPLKAQRQNSSAARTIRVNDAAASGQRHEYAGGST